MTARTRHPLENAWAVALGGFGLLLLGSCAAAPKPQPLPRVVTVKVVPPPVPSPMPPPADWRDAPQSPGTWTWALVGGQSTASYGQPGAAPLAVLVCDRPNARLLLARAGSATAPVPMAVRTTFSLRPLTSDPAISRPGWVTVALGARDPLLDAMAFSRGRFTIEVAGLEALYLPAWPELSRVIEDCR